MRTAGKHRRGKMKIKENVKLTGTNVSACRPHQRRLHRFHCRCIFLESGSFFPECDPLIAAPTCTGAVNQGRLRDPFARSVNLQNFKFSDHISHAGVFPLIFLLCCMQAPNITMPTFPAIFSAPPPVILCSEVVQCSINKSPDTQTHTHPGQT